MELLFYCAVCIAGDSHVALISAAQSEAVCSAFCNVTPGLAMRCLTYWMKLCLTSAYVRVCLDHASIVLLS